MPEEGGLPASRCHPTLAPPPRHIAPSEPAKACAFSVVKHLCQHPWENWSQGGMSGRAKGQGNLC